MQFKVPQNIDMEDKIVGPLTLIQFLYVLGGGMIIYLLFQTLYTSSIALFVILSLPIALIALALAFLKIQEQPLSHFITAGLQFWQKPKMRYWHNIGESLPILKDAPRPKVTQIAPAKKQIEKSNLEQLAYSLDTRPMDQQEQKNFGKVSEGFSQLLAKENKAPQQSSGQGGQVGVIPQTTTNR